MLILLPHVISARSDATDNDSIYCFVLKDIYQNLNLSRSQLITKLDSIVQVKIIPALKIDPILNNLEFIRDLDCSAKEFALDWAFENDSTLYFKSESRPVRALLIRYRAFKPGESKHKNIAAHIISISWVTDQTIDIESEEYRLSPELNELLFGDN